MEFGVYKRYPFQIPLRVKFFNVFRFFFKFSVLERFLIERLSRSNASYWRKFIPPLYFYPNSSIRLASRGDISFRLDISKMLDHSIYFFNIRDVAWENLIKVLRPCFNVIDVGANIGFLALTFAKHCPGGTIYCFEPDSNNFCKLKENVRLNTFGKIELFRKAAGKNAGYGQLYKLYESNPGANRVLQENPINECESERVEIVSLDAMANENVFTKVDLVKIDVEGFELFVLQGACELINRWRPILFVELVDLNLREQGCSSAAVISFIENLGYSILDAKTMLPLKALGGNQYTDIICFHHAGIK